MSLRTRTVAAGALAVLLGAGTAALGSQNAVGAAEKATAAPVPSTHFVNFDFAASGLSPGKILTVEYVQGVTFEPGGIMARGDTSIDTTSGSLVTTRFFNNAFVLDAGQAGTVASVSEGLPVGTPPLQVQARIPDGVTLSVTNETTKQTVPMTNNVPVSVTTGVSGFAATSADPSVIEAEGAAGLALTAPASGGGAVSLTPIANSPSQEWRFAAEDAPETSIVNVATSQCLTAQGTSSGASVVTAPCDGSKSQEWIEGGKTNGSHRFLNEISSKSSLVLSAAVGSSGVNVDAVDGSILQDWLVQPGA
ncbi:MAG TPA: RICIN domain-containing protein [Acidimicrobiales bacterium]|nr:RICIN domain-containing protein [Acidimicrobiales bacterium]